MGEPASVAEPAREVGTDNGTGSEVGRLGGGAVEEATTDVGERGDGDDSGKGKEEEKEGGRVGEPAKDVGVTGVKQSKRTGKEETHSEGAGTDGGEADPGGKEEGGMVLSPTTEMGEKAEGGEHEEKGPGTKDPAG